jgi:hypothetical protein
MAAMKARRKTTGKIISKRRGWEIGPTRFETLIEAIHGVQRMRFVGLRVREDNQFVSLTVRKRRVDHAARR